MQYNAVKTRRVFTAVKTRGVFTALQLHTKSPNTVKKQGFAHVAKRGNPCGSLWNPGKTNGNSPNIKLFSKGE